MCGKFYKIEKVTLFMHFGQKKCTVTQFCKKFVHLYTIIRAITSAGVKNFPFYTSKTYFFYFTFLILQNSHINLSIIYLYFNRIFIFFFLLFSSLIFFTASLPPYQTQPPSSTLPDRWNTQFENHSRLNHHPPKIRKPFKIKLRDQKPI